MIRRQSMETIKLIDACTYEYLNNKTRLTEGSKDVVQTTSGEQHESNLGCKVRKVEM